MANNEQKTSKNMIRLVSRALMVCGIIGLAASFILAIETVASIKNPEQALSCNINPIVSCSSVIETPQGEVLGFMNPLIGIVAFSMLIVFSLSLMYGAKFPKFIWLAAQAVSGFALAFVHWLIYTSIYDLGALCPYCMVVWAVTIPTALYVTIHNINSGLLGERIKPVGDFLLRKHYALIMLWYGLIIALIINQFGLSNLLTFS